MGTRGKLLLELAMQNKNSGPILCPNENVVLISELSASEVNMPSIPKIPNNTISISNNSVISRISTDNGSELKDVYPSCSNYSAKYGNTVTSSTSSRSSSSSSSSNDWSEDNDDSIADETFKLTDINNSDESSDEKHKKKSETNETQAETASTSFTPHSTDLLILTSPSKKGKKRKRNVQQWKRNLSKIARNTGKAYETTSKKMKQERSIKPGCKETCRLKCKEKITEEIRIKLFKDFWSLGNIEQQRQFIAGSTKLIEPKYRYMRIGGSRSQRKLNNAFYFNMPDEIQIRVCKTFFKHTLDITDRCIRTVEEKKTMVAGMLVQEDQRGKHGQQKTVDECIKNGIRNHILSIPKIESHYTRANTSRHFIDGSKNISDIHKDYLADCRIKNVPFGNYTLFYRIFTEEFNISFFQPKKDLCDVCAAFVNVEGEDKENMKEKYDQHLLEKDLSRAEKNNDKEDTNINDAVAERRYFDFLLQIEVERFKFYNIRHEE